jgi:hypothetical protein
MSIIFDFKLIKELDPLCCKIINDLCTFNKTHFEDLIDSNTKYEWQKYANKPQFNSPNYTDDDEIYNLFKLYREPNEEEMKTLEKLKLLGLMQAGIRTGEYYRSPTFNRIFKNIT